LLELARDLVILDLVADFDVVPKDGFVTLEHLLYEDKLLEGF